MQKKASVVNAGKQNLVIKQNENSGKIGKDVAKKAVVQKGSAAIGQNKDQQKNLETILFGEYSDLFVNWLSKAFGLHEHWKSLFETYEGDPYKAAKYGFAALLLVVKIWYALDCIFSLIMCFWLYNLRKGVSFEDAWDTWGTLFSSENNLGRERTLFNLYAYNRSLPALVLRALCPAVSIPAFVLSIKSSIFNERKIIVLKREWQSYKEDLEKIKNRPEYSLYKSDLKENLERVKNELLELGVNVADM